MRTLAALAGALLVFAACDTGGVPTDAGPASSTIEPLSARGGGAPAFRATDAAVGFRHSCALDPAGSAWCWGLGDLGRLGTGGTADAETPVRVAGGLRFVEIDASNNHTCGLTRSGEAWCWGSNVVGQLGDGTTTDRLTPVRVAGGLRFTHVSAGNLHSCGVADDGTGYCWGLASRPVGSNRSALGAPAPDSCPIFGTTAGCALEPVQVSGGLSFTEIDASLETSCGLTTGGRVYCWGWNGWWQFGDGSDVDAATPVLAAGGKTFVSLAQGAAHGCGITASGAAHCWGARFFGGVHGALGTGSFVGSPVPLAVAGGHAFTALTASRANNVFSFTCGLTGRRGDALCWGSDRMGSVGNETDTVTCSFFPAVASYDCSAEPVPVAGDLAFEQLSAGNEATCGAALTRAGWCWGSDRFDLLGVETAPDLCATPFVASGQVECARTPVRIADVRPAGSSAAVGALGTSSSGADAAGPATAIVRPVTSSRVP